MLINKQCDYDYVRIGVWALCTSWLTSRPSAEFSDTLGLGKIRGFWEFLIFYKDNPTIIRGLELDLVIMQLATYYGKKESCRSIGNWK